MIMKKKLTLRFALLILCAFSMNTAFAQDVRQKPVVKKQTTTTTKKQNPASTKKQTSTKQAAKKQSSASTKQNQVNHPQGERAKECTPKGPGGDSKRPHDERPDRQDR